MILITLRHRLNIDRDFLQLGRDALSLLLLLDTNWRTRREKVGRVLHISYQYRRRVEVELLSGVVAAEGKQRRTRAIHGNAADVVECWNQLISDILSSYIPSACFAEEMLVTISQGSAVDVTVHMRQC
jgi:hypothetical protein